MKLLKLCALITALASVSQAYAQDRVAAATRQSQLRALAADLQLRAANDRRAAEAFAKRAGIPLRRALPSGGVLELQRIAPGIGPVFYITNNILAAQTTSTDEVWPGGSAGLSLTGAGMTLAEWDGGAVDASHSEFSGRVTQQDGATEVSGHSTHVAGTLIGAGVPLLDLRGMAYEASLDAYDWHADVAEMALAAANGQLVSNHSYGTAAGWIATGELDPPDAWWWIGGADPGIQEDPNFGYYDTESQLWDQIAFDAPYYLIVKSAGNDRSDIGPGLGEEYTIVDQDGEPIETSTAPRLPDCAPAGYDCLPTHSVAKNILTIGAVDDLPGGYSPLGGPEQVQMADFSGWGPTDDGRIKPDLVGNGMFLFSAWPDAPGFAAAAGTSMSAPNVSGSLLLLQQHYQNLHGSGNYLRAATVKALAIHTADEAGPAPGPDYAFGWGLLNTQSAAAAISGTGGDYQLVESNLANGDVDTYPVDVTVPDTVVTATLVWADPPGTPPVPALDPTDSMLVNDLDLRVARGGNTWLPWVLNPADPSAPATSGDNLRDNVEQVRISGADTCSYSVSVQHKGNLQGGSAQPYSLIISVDAPPAAGSLLIDEDFAGGLPAGWGVDTVEGAAWTIKTPVPDDWRLDNNTGGDGLFAMVDSGTAQTLTTLRTPVLDLSDYDAAVLRFKSYFFFDFFEIIAVDASTDGGSNWSAAWENPIGNNHTPSQLVLDLSAALAGQANVMLRFRFDSDGEPQGNLWQIDDIELEVFGPMPTPGALPGPATAPSPGDGATGVAWNASLTWTGGAQADSHDVYFGTTAPLGPVDFQGNQPGTSFDPGALAPGTTYYWRADQVNAEGSLKGCTWMFTTLSELPEVIHASGFEDGEGG
jgi:hypothetical protein